MIHLAVESKNVEIVNHLLNFVRGSDKQQVLQMFQAKNNVGRSNRLNLYCQAGMTPRDLAISYWRNDIVASLQSHYSTYETLAQLDELSMLGGAPMPAAPIQPGLAPSPIEAPPMKGQEWQQMQSPVRRSVAPGG